MIVSPLRVSPPHPLGGRPTWNGVLSSSWWNRSMCGPLLMLASDYTDTRFVTMARTGGLSWYRLGIWPCTRYGRDRGESGESAARIESCHKRPKEPFLYHVKRTIRVPCKKVRLGVGRSLG